MASAREIRRRIRSVKNIGKVTKAMETVAASKMRRAQQQVLSTRPYAEKSWEVLTYLARLRGESGPSQPLLEERPVEKVGVLLITGDRGMAGAYNSNVLRTAAREIYQWEKKDHKQVSLITIGSKGRDWMLRHGPPLLAEFTGLSERPTSNDIAPVAQIVIEDFIAGVYDAVYIVYTRFVNTLRQEPMVRQLLPIVPAKPDIPLPPDYIFEPDAETVLSEVLYGITELQILQAVYEAIASEQSARMVAMRNATDAANELISDLTLKYNKVRQEAITRELIDIVGGSVGLAKAAASTSST
jgi:F-type H+-transporting ATPase subunit gamma